MKLVDTFLIVAALWTCTYVLPFAQKDFLVYDTKFMWRIIMPRMWSVEGAGPQSSDFVFEVEHWLNGHWKYSIMYIEDVKLINQM